MHSIGYKNSNNTPIFAMGHDEVHIISHYIRSSRTCHVYLLAYGTNVHVCQNKNVMVNVHNDRCVFKTSFTAPLASVQTFLGRKKTSVLLKKKPLIGRGETALAKNIQRSFSV